MDPDLLKDVIERNANAVNMAYAAYKTRVEADPSKGFPSPNTNLVQFEYWDKLDPPFDDVPNKTATLPDKAEMDALMAKAASDAASKKKR